MSARRIRREHVRRRAKGRAVAAGSAVAASIALAPAAQAATFTVDSTADGPADGCDPGLCTLRDAIEAADANSEPDTITFATGLSGEITLGAPLVVNSTDGISVDGPGVSVVSISGDTNTDDTPGAGDTDLLRVYGGSIGISDLTLTEGFPDSAPSPKYGGAITTTPESEVTIEDSALTDNYAPYIGGAIVNRQSTVVLKGSDLSGNTATFGGAVYAVGPKYTPSSPPGQNPGASTTITGSTLEGNTASPNGGPISIGAAIFNVGTKYNSAPAIPEKGQLTITGTTITGNEAEEGLAGGVFSKYAEATVADTAVDGNVAAGGGGLAILAGSADIDRTTISGNSDGGNAIGSGSFAGGMLSLKYADLSVADSSITGNSAYSVGGAVVDLRSGSGKYAPPSPAEATFVRTTIAGNEASAYSAGGLEVAGVAPDAAFELRDSTISGNSADAAAGGGIAFYDAIEGDARIINSTVSGNSAAYGGGISVGGPYGSSSPGYGAGSGAPAVINSTIAANTAGTAGGGIYLGGYSSDSSTPDAPSAQATVPLSSTIVADNAAGGSPGDLAAATVDQPGTFQLGNSLVEAPGSAPVDQVPAGSNILGTDPQLGPLADNGGPTRTHLPANGSPAIDSGVANGLTTDQRGLARTSGDGGTDIGSVEVQQAPPDTTAPVITIAKRPKHKLKTAKRKRRVRIGFKSDEPGSTFECRINGAAFEPCDRPFKRKLKAKRGNGKKYRIRIRATDPAGNTGRAAKVKVRVIRKG